MPHAGLEVRLADRTGRRPRIRWRVDGISCIRPIAPLGETARAGSSIRPGRLPGPAAGRRRTRAADAIDQLADGHVRRVAALAPTARPASASRATARGVGHLVGQRSRRRASLGACIFPAAAQHERRPVALERARLRPTSPGRWSVRRGPREPDRGSTSASSACTAARRQASSIVASSPYLSGFDERVKDADAQLRGSSCPPAGSLRRHERLVDLDPEFGHVGRCRAGPR